MDSLWDQQDKELPWIYYFMPPFPPLFATSLPFARDSHVDETWDTYQNGATDLKSWKENEMIERLRHLLEDCDSLQGVVLLTEGCGIYSGLAVALLQELCEESKAASLHAGLHRIMQCSIITWLKRNISKPFTREICAEDKQFAMVEMA